MILFHGDSYTWGSGLEYHYLVEEQGYSWKDCEKFLPSEERLEMFPRDLHLYRENNRFASIVGKELNMKEIVTSYRNGGDTFNIIDRLNSGQCQWDSPNIFLHIVQFSAPNRNLPDNFKVQPIEDVMRYQIDKIHSLVEGNWLGISWFPEYAELMKEMYPDKLITIDYENETHDSFEHLTQRDGLSYASTFGLDDYHFTLEGHKLIADSIIKKIKELNKPNELLNI